MTKGRKNPTEKPDRKTLALKAGSLEAESVQTNSPPGEWLNDDDDDDDDKGARACYRSRSFFNSIKKERIL